MKRIQLGPLTLDAIILDDGDLDTFVESARQARDADRIVLLNRLPALRRGQKADEPVRKMDLDCLVETIGDCAAVPVHAVDGSVVFPDFPWGALMSPLHGIPLLPFLLARFAVLRQVLSYLDDLPPDEVVCRSRPVRTDFREFAALWDGPEESSASIVRRLTGPGNGRAVRVLGIGEALATGHRNGALLGDAHEGNFMMDAGGQVKIIDHDFRPLLRSPSSAQCATDLSPLLPTFSPADWQAFRFGYLGEWPDGRRVIDFIEYADTTGWMHRLARREYAPAVEALDSALTACPPGDTLGRMVLTANRSYALLRLGRYAEARTASDEAIAIAAAEAPQFMPLLLCCAALARQGAGERDQAARIAVTLAVGSTTPAVKDVAMRILSSADVPDDDLPFLVRQAGRLLVIEPFSE